MHKAKQPFVAKNWRISLSGATIDARAPVKVGMNLRTRLQDCKRSIRPIVDLKFTCAKTKQSIQQNYFVDHRRILKLINTGFFSYHRLNPIMQPSDSFLYQIYY